MCYNYMVNTGGAVKVEQGGETQAFQCKEDSMLNKANTDCEVSCQYFRKFQFTLVASHQKDFSRLGRVTASG